MVESNRSERNGCERTTAESSVLSRRRLVAGVGVGAVATIAGCLGDDDADDSGGESSSGTTADEHALGQKIDKLPSKGAEPFQGDSTLIVLDDPKCPACASFHEDTVAEYKSAVVESGDGTIVAAPYPGAYPEAGGAAWKVLKKTYKKDEAAFWKLQTHLFEDQSWDEESVFEVAKAYLDSHTDLDGEEVVEATKAEKDELQAFIDDVMEAAESEGGDSMPYVFMFKGDEYITGENGPGYSTIEATLEL